MREFSGSGPIRPCSWLFGAMTLLLLPACTTTRSADEADFPKPPTVDVGYGGVTDGHLAGSAIILRDQDIRALQPQTLGAMLARLPGVRVIELHGGGFSVRIRGSSSFLGGEEPLFLLDGMPIQTLDGALRGIHPYSVESITLLRDAGETAIYGSRGANGVILIKTKSGPG
jgi:TonB-dependent SusC/RagA subfamily outer membrane receptor